MKLHSNAALTVSQRRQVKTLFEQGQSVAALATRFGVHQTTIRRWIGREVFTDRPHPQRGGRLLTPDYEQAVIAYRQEHPTHGPVRIAHALRAQFPQAHRGTALQILQRNGLTRPRRRVRTAWQIPVGRHRVQMDIQQLPAVKGERGFEYKISLIHLRTRLKYSEIHRDSSSATVAGVFRRALDQLPPFSSSGPTTR